MCAVTFGPKSQNHRNVGWRGLWRSPEPPRKQLVAILCPLLAFLKTICLCCLYNSPLSDCRLQLDCFSVSSSARSWGRDCSCSDDLLRVGGLRRAVKMQGRKLIVLNVLICCLSFAMHTRLDTHVTLHQLPDSLWEGSFVCQGIKVDVHLSVTGC